MRIVDSKLLMVNKLKSIGRVEHGYGTSLLYAEDLPCSTWEGVTICRITSCLWVFVPCFNFRPETCLKKDAILTKIAISMIKLKLFLKIIIIIF